jgi:hypothetical protein
MHKAIIFIISLSFISISGFSTDANSSGKPLLIPGKSKPDSKENKKKRKPMNLRLPSDQLKKDFQVF